ncbi:MAG: autotransporter domain-containing protein [Xanthomonadaceae bacterium]|nr:autotransporter domain-containing protein [Xanthomonadaceae bacterium]
MTRCVRHPLCLTVAAALALTAAPAFAQSAQTFEETVFFGDSLTDAGFFRPLLPASAQPVTGQFTTNPGLVWSQYLADYYGTSASPAWLATSPTTPPRADTGTNYAVGGARVGTDSTGALGSTPSLNSQVTAYLARTGGKANPNALYTVWGGANDLFAIVAGAPVQATLTGAVTTQVGIVGRLQAAGAQYILVPTIPDLGITPSFRAQGAAAAAQGTALATNYNTALFTALSTQNLRVIPLNTFTFLQEIVANPGAYNFRNVTGTACQPQITAQSLTCNPTSYVTPDAASAYAFADGVHPTTAAHKLLSDYAVATIEGPRQIAVLPHSAASIGRARADLLADQLDARQGVDGSRIWGDVRYDNQRYKRGMAGDGFDGDGVTLTAGYDRRSNALVYGVFGNIGRQDIDYGARRGDYKQKEAGIGGHVGWHGASGWVDGHIGWTRLDFDINRDVWLGPAMRTHTGSPGGDNLSAGISGGWRFQHGKLSHGPVVRVLSQHIDIDGYTESQPELSTALAFPDQKFDSLQGSLGWQADLQLGEHVQVFARATMDREFEDTPAQAYAQVTSLPNTMPFAVPGVKFDDKFVTLASGVRSQVWGLDVSGGSSVTVADVGGSNLSLYVSVGKRF